MLVAIFSCYDMLLYRVGAVLHSYMEDYFEEAFPPFLLSQNRWWLHLLCDGSFIVVLQLHFIVAIMLLIFFVLHPYFGVAFSVAVL